MSALLAVDSLTIALGAHTVASNVCFTLAAGEAVAVLGPNGAGKTTLLRTVLGLIPSVAGSITLAGKPLATLAPAARARSMAYVPQSLTMPLDFCVRDVVLMARLNHHAWYAAPSEHDVQAAESAIAQMGIAPLTMRAFSTLSGGEQQLALIARALATEAPILILDEPVASLDLRHQHTLLSHLAELKVLGKAILFSTHHPEHAGKLAGTVVTIDATGMSQNGATAQILTAENLSTLYGIALNVTRTESGTLFIAVR